MNLGRHLASYLQLGTLKNFLFSHNKIRYIQIEFARYRQAGRDRDGCYRFAPAKSPNLICTLHTAYLADKVAGWVISSKYLALLNIMVTNLIFCCLTLTGSLVWVGRCTVLILNFWLCMLSLLCMFSNVLQTLDNITDCEYNNLWWLFFV